MTGCVGSTPRALRRISSAILDKLEARHIPVLLAGMYAPPNLGPQYEQAFRAVFTRLGARPGILYEDFFLTGVAADPALNQPDHIHPNAKGVRIVVTHLLPLVHQTAGGGRDHMRLFVALDLPWELRERLAALGGGVPGARWVPADNLHLTLRFIGEVPPFRAEEDRPRTRRPARAALSARARRRWHLRQGGAGDDAVGRRGAQRTARAPAGQDRNRSATRRPGAGAAALRAARHAGAARQRGTRQARRLRAARTTCFAPSRSRSEHFTLFSSRLGKEHAAYEPEVEYALA